MKTVPSLSSSRDSSRREETKKNPEITPVKNNSKIEKKEPDSMKKVMVNI